MKGIAPRPTAPSRLLEKELDAFKRSVFSQIDRVTRENLALKEQVAALSKRLDTVAVYVTDREDV